MQKSKSNSKWYENWFDSAYYHLLYKNRDDSEAQFFIDNLINCLQPAKNSILLDTACGKGRHAIYMNKLGYTVDAYDLSENSINVARKSETNNLHFYINDIRSPLRTNYYDYAFNLFTSFGYFEKEADHLKAVKSLADSLKSKGTLVLDFMNIEKVIDNLVPNEKKVIDHIKFSISRSVQDNFIVKTISLIDNNQKLTFHEKVKAITYKDFIRYFESANLDIKATFGDYSLNRFDVKTSDRLILLAKKNE